MILARQFISSTRKEENMKINKSAISALFIVFGIVCLTSCRQTKMKTDAEKVFINAHVVTMDESVPTAEAFAVGRGKFLAVGSSKEMLRSYPQVEVVDLRGRTVMPGIVESHGHLLSLGQSFLELNLEGVKTPEEAVLKVRQRVEAIPEGEWITGWGWDEGAWAKSYPTQEALSRVSPDNPVYLRGLHGFASWVNKRALEIARVTKDTPNPENGEIIRDKLTGQPAGILINAAQELVARHIPPLDDTQVEKALKLAIQECLKNGLTSVHEARTTAAILRALRSLKERNELQCRIYVMLDWTDKDLLEPFFTNGPEVDLDHMLTARCIKVFVDGALGSRGAAMLEPYSDSPGEKGVVVTSEDELAELTLRALRSNLQVAVHAIGDRANRITLNAFRRALDEIPERMDHRLRVEHVQVVALEDIPKFAPLGLVLSMQPPHCTSDMPWAEDRVGPERIKGAYAWRSFLRTGIHITLNSDFPGETLNPFFGMYAAMTRQTPMGVPEEGWYPEQCLTREEVLKGYIVEAAYSGFEENIKGRILPGMLADFIVLSDDILSIPEKEFLSLRVLETHLGGKLVYKKVG